MKKQEQYSTERAWGVKANRAQVEYFEKIADRLRRTNEQLQKTLTSKEMYIEKLEQKIESLEKLNHHD